MARNVVYLPARRSRAGPVVFVAVLAGLLLASGHGPHAPKAAPRTSAATAGYVNPLGGGPWLLDRIDQGVDYKPTSPAPVRAIGPGVVVYSSSTDCPPGGWPGCHVIGYRLTAGPAKGRVVFVAEHLTGLLGAGARLWPGRVIATALPGYPWTEWGWAHCGGSGPIVPYGGAADGTSMPGGIQFARFMRQLGAVPPSDGNAENPGRGRAIPAATCTP